jgi:hypothetical protein
MKSLKTILLVEDNLGDARLLREMLKEQSSLDTQLTHLQCMSEQWRRYQRHLGDGG